MNRFLLRFSIACAGTVTIAASGCSGVGTTPPTGDAAPATRSAAFHRTIGLGPVLSTKLGDIRRIKRDPHAFTY